MKVQRNIKVMDVLLEARFGLRFRFKPLKNISQMIKLVETTNFSSYYVLNLA